VGILFGLVGEKANYVSTGKGSVATELVITGNSAKKCFNSIP
jgi:hypothetical protein